MRCDILDESGRQCVVRTRTCVADQHRHVFHTCDEDLDELLTASLKPLDRAGVQAVIHDSLRRLEACGLDDQVDFERVRAAVTDATMRLIVLDRRAHKK